MNKSNPFSWEFNQEAEFKTIPTQMKSNYSSAAQEVFVGSEKDVFFSGIEAPTPQLKYVVLDDNNETEEEQQLDDNNNNNNNSSESDNTNTTTNTDTTTVDNGNGGDNTNPSQSTEQTPDSGNSTPNT